MTSDRLYSSAEAALALGIGQRRVQQIARRLGIGREIGGTLVFRPEELVAMRTRPLVGRPRKDQQMSDYAATALGELYVKQQRLGAGDPVTQGNRAQQLADHYRAAGNEAEAERWQALARQHRQDAEVSLAATLAIRRQPVHVRVWAPDGSLLGEEHSTHEAAASVPVFRLINQHQRALGNVRELTGRPEDGIYTRSVSPGVWECSPFNPPNGTYQGPVKPWYRVACTNPDGTPHGI